MAAASASAACDRFATGPSPHTVPAPTTTLPTLSSLAGRYAARALANITREFPYSQAYMVGSADHLRRQRDRHPAFWGAYDWHSSVHMHWLLVRLLRRYPEQIDAACVAGVLDARLEPGNLAAEAARLRAEPAFERPYGWAWLLALTAECRAVGERGEVWAQALRPAAATVGDLLLQWLPKATHPVRHGVHGNSAFAMGLVIDAADGAGVPEAGVAAAGAVTRWFAGDSDYPAGWEPSGEDFLSPALTEADAVRRVLPPEAFADWLGCFLPGLAHGLPLTLLDPPAACDPADPQIGHLLGLSLSRAASLRGIAGALPAGDPRVPLLRSSAQRHLVAGLPHVLADDFTSGHWLATFAALALEGGS
jgi:hypothetical protein